MSIKYIQISCNYVRFTAKIIKQSHRVENFGKEKNQTFFKTSKKYTIYSNLYPKYYPSDNNTCYIRGVERDNDNDTIQFDSISNLLKFEDAVNEYNQYFNNINYSMKIKKEIDRILNI